MAGRVLLQKLETNPGQPQFKETNPGQPQFKKLIRDSHKNNPGQPQFIKTTKPGQPPFKKWLAVFGKKKQQCCSAMKFQRYMGVFIFIIGFGFFLISGFLQARTMSSNASSENSVDFWKN